jgi:ATP-dependent Clp protease ATP-binding subunit ClpA
MVDCYTEEFIKVIMLAQDESRRLGHSFVCTEQILLGTIGEGTSVAAEILKSKGVTLEQARIEVEKISGRGSDFAILDYPFTPKVSRAIELALEEAEQLKRNYIDAEHLLLGTLRIEDGIAVQVLVTLGVDATEIRDLIVRRLGDKFSQKARCVRALEVPGTVGLAVQKAAQLEPKYLDAEHPLFGKLPIEDKIFFQVLVNAGLNMTEISDLMVGLGENTQA